MKLILDVVVVAIDYDGTMHVYGPFKSMQQADRYVSYLEHNELCDNATVHRMQKPDRP